MRGRLVRGCALLTLLLMFVTGCANMGQEVSENKGLTIGGLGGMVEQFFLLDKGRKGYLLREEVVAVSAQDFKAANRKGDGKLSLQEFVNARFVDFVAADRDRDGSLTLEEIQVYSRC
jgi:Ca2+-binding EF-hand superfamily protein